MPASRIKTLRDWASRHLFRYRASVAFVSMVAIMRTDCSGPNSFSSFHTPLLDLRHLTLEYHVVNNRLIYGATKSFGVDPAF